MYVTVIMFVQTQLAQLHPVAHVLCAASRCFSAMNCCQTESFSSSKAWRPRLDRSAAFSNSFFHRIMITCWSSWECPFSLCCSSLNLQQTEVQWSWSWCNFAMQHNFFLPDVTAVLLRFKLCLFQPAHETPPQVAHLTPKGQRVYFWHMDDNITFARTYYQRHQ